MRKNKKIILLTVLIVTILSIVGCKAEEKEGGVELNSEQLQMPKTGEEVAIIKTNLGDIKLRLFPEVAPKAVENFKTHAKNGYYNGVTFHRVMEDFMIQGGDPQGTGRGGESIWGASFEDEFHEDYKNLYGTLSMANAGPGTNGSQFFIVQKSDGTDWLDFKHTVFGQVYEGMDVVDKIAKVKTGSGDRPVEPVVMETIEIVEYK